MPKSQDRPFSRKGKSGIILENYRQKMFGSHAKTQAKHLFADVIRLTTFFTILDLSKTMHCSVEVEDVTVEAGDYRRKLCDSFFSLAVAVAQNLL